MKILFLIIILVNICFSSTDERSQSFFEYNINGVNCKDSVNKNYITTCNSFTKDGKGLDKIIFVLENKKVLNIYVDKKNIDLFFYFKDKKKLNVFTYGDFKINEKFYFNFSDGLRVNDSKNIKSNFSFDSKAKIYDFVDKSNLLEINIIEGSDNSFVIRTVDRKSYSKINVIYNKN